MKWRNRQGAFIEVSDMTMHHLENTIAMLHRRREELALEVEAAWSMVASASGDAASYTADGLVDAAEQRLRSITTAWRGLLEERNKRLRNPMSRPTP
jgi:hypothetical protein